MKKPSKRDIALICMGVFIGICVFIMLSKPEVTEMPPIHMSSPISPHEYKSAQWAANVLMRACPKLFTEYKDDISHVDAEFTHNDIEWCKFDFRCKDYGWTDYVLINVTLKNELAEIPHKFHAWNQTLYYYIGLNGKFGILSLKAQSQDVCNWPEEPAGGNLFINLQ